MQIACDIWTPVYRRDQVAYPKTNDPIRRASLGQNVHEDRWCAAVVEGAVLASDFDCPRLRRGHMRTGFALSNFLPEGHVSLPRQRVAKTLTPGRRFPVRRDLAAPRPHTMSES